MSIVLIDATSSSLTVTWPSTPGATKYVLEYRTAGELNFVSLSDKLIRTQARKNNLNDPDGAGFIFRAGALIGDEASVTSWVTHAKPFVLLSEAQEKEAMSAPKVTHAGSNYAVVVSWSAVDRASGYEVQMRENEGGAEWKTIAPSFSGTEVRKKNLISTLGYQFRLRPSGDGDEAPFSPASDAVVARGLSEGIKRFFNSLEEGTLLRSGVKEPVPLADALGGKEFILVYVSAHWCPPCRKYTPMLAKWYQSARNFAEIVFLSADHDKKGFQSYFATHPWMAVDFDDDAREQLMAAIQVSGIPRLVVMSGITGKIIEDNAVGKPLDINRWRGLAATN
jgi:thiol-disulfide isomerase/thioredoxin